MSIPTAAIAATKLLVTSASAAASTYMAVEGYKSQSGLAEANSEAANDAYILETQMMGQRRSQELAAASERQSDNQIKSMKGSATALTSAAAGNVQGRTVEDTLFDFKRNAGIVSGRLDTSTDWRLDQMTAEGAGLKSKADARIGSTPPPNMGSVWAAGIGSAGKAIGGWQDFSETVFDPYDYGGEP